MAPRRQSLVLKEPLINVGLEVGLRLESAKTLNKTGKCGGESGNRAIG